MVKAGEKIQKAGDAVRSLPGLMRRSFSELQKNDPLRLAGATAFFTTFALPPILIILIQLFGIFFSEYDIRKELIVRLGRIIGRSSALQTSLVLENFGKLGKHWHVATVGFLFLIFVATTLFTVIKNSLNQIWQIKVISNPGIFFTLKLRFRAFCIILFAGVLFTAGIIMESIQALLGNYLSFVLPETGKLFNSTLNEIFFVVVVTIWFTTLFRYLTDGKPAWKVAWAGGFFTGILFTLGKVVLRELLTYSKIGSIYGTSASVVLILLFVFYSSLIFYFGGCFVKILSDKLQCPIQPHGKAFHYELQEIVSQ